MQNTGSDLNGIDFRMINRKIGDAYMHELNKLSNRVLASVRKKLLQFEMRKSSEGTFESNFAVQNVNMKTLQIFNSSIELFERDFDRLIESQKGISKKIEVDFEKKLPSSEKKHGLYLFEDEDQSGKKSKSGRYGVIFEEGDKSGSIGLGKPQSNLELRDAREDSVNFFSRKEREYEKKGIFEDNPYSCKTGFFASEFTDGMNNNRKADLAPVQASANEKNGELFLSKYEKDPSSTEEFCPTAGNNIFIQGVETTHSPLSSKILAFVTRDDDDTQPKLPPLPQDSPTQIEHSPVPEDPHLPVGDRTNTFFHRALAISCSSSVNEGEEELSVYYSSNLSKTPVDMDNNPEEGEEEKEPDEDEDNTNFF